MFTLFCATTRFWIMYQVEALFFDVNFDYYFVLCAFSLLCHD